MHAYQDQQDCHQTPRTFRGPRPYTGHARLKHRLQTGRMASSSAVAPFELERPDGRTATTRDRYSTSRSRDPGGAAALESKGSASRRSPRRRQAAGRTQEVAFSGTEENLPRGRGGPVRLKSGTKVEESSARGRRLRPLLRRRPWGGIGGWRTTSRERPLAGDSARPAATVGAVEPAAPRPWGRALRTPPFRGARGGFP